MTTTTDTKPAEAKPRTNEEWAALFASARAYVPVQAMASEAALKAAKFDLEQAKRVEQYRDELAADAEEWDKAEDGRRAGYYGSLLPPLPRRGPAASLAALPRLPVAEPSPEPVLAAPVVAADEHEQASKADLARWAPKETLDDEKAETAVERVIAIHDTDPAGETADATAILPGLEDEPPA
jgi:hypothetical protein